MLPKPQARPPIIRKRERNAKRYGGGQCDSGMVRHRRKKRPGVTPALPRTTTAPAGCRRDRQRKSRGAKEESGYNPELRRFGRTSTAPDIPRKASRVGAAASINPAEDGRRPMDDAVSERAECAREGKGSPTRGSDRREYIPSIMGGSGLA
jgi:hypothetical protein